MDLSALAASNVLLWVAVIALATIVLALARQIGVLHERIAPAGALLQTGGLKPGDTAPALELGSLADGAIRLQDYFARGRGVLIFFLSPTCPLCRALLPVVERIAREERDKVELLYASDGGTREDHEKYVAERNLAHPYVISLELGLALQVNKLPYAALFDSHGVLVAKGLVNTREHLESLFEAQRLGVSDINQYLAADGRAESRSHDRSYEGAHK
jgi:methylamine dehydrogenase accessory protein MauD